MIDTLCQEHTDLTGQDIAKIKETASSIEMVAQLMGADIFIDCWTRDPDVAIVVAQAKPKNGKSLYKGSVVGQFAYRSNEPAVLRTLEIGMPTTDMWAITQEYKNVRQNVSAIKNDAGRVIGVLIAETDITEHVNEQKNLSALSWTTERLMEALIGDRQKEHNLPYHDTDGIVMFNRIGVCIYANSVADNIYRKLGYIDNLEGIPFSNMALENIAFKDILEKKQLSLSEVKVGSLVLNIKCAVVKKRNGMISAVVMLIRDDTDLKAKEKELILKSVAIKEIHHRVKNNLQTIASLLRLQSRRIDSDSVKTAFNESISRVLSIAATHEILAQNGVDDVDILTMLQRIKNSVVNHSMLLNKSIRITITGDTFLCNSDTATSISLVVNEVIQNCFKHAFHGRTEGQITIEICKGATYGNISIIDNGVGFDASKMQASTLGTQIIKGIVRDKLHGDLTIESGAQGTKILFDFTLEPEGHGQDETEPPKERVQHAIDRRACQEAGAEA